jgi:uncharacterized membrane protein
MLPFLSKPYPYNPVSGKDLGSNFLIGCFVAFFLLVFQPFDISLWETPYRFWKIMGFGVVSFLCPTIFRLLSALALRYSKPEESWTVWKEILALLLVLLFIALGNMLYGNLIGIAAISFSHLALAVLATILLGIFPITANVALKYNRFQALNRKEAEQIDQEVKSYQQRADAEQPQQNDSSLLETPLLILVAENEKDRLELRPEDLLYIESADNYSNIVFLKKGLVSRELIRGSLKRLETQITIPYIIRCHRSYIVNVRQVNEVSGNAQGYKIGFKISGVNPVPVSRNYGKEVLAHLEAMR